MARWSMASLAALALGGGAPRSTAQEGSPRVVSRTLLSRDAGRVDWCGKRDLIAFDRITRGSVDAPEASEVFAIRPDGSGERCVTCGAPGLPHGVRGQPAWHPSCAFLVVQVQSPAYRGNRFEFVSWGVNNDLWFVAADGRWATRAFATGKDEAALHPHFSADGRRLFFAVRRPTGRRLPPLIRRLAGTPDGENPWTGWSLALAPVVGDGGSARLGPVRRFHSDGLGSGFYETHGIAGGRLYFSHSAAPGQVDDVFFSDLDGGNAVNVSRSPDQWDEHLERSPGGALLTWNSSRETGYAFPRSRFPALRLELWARSADGRMTRLTNNNAGLPRGARALTSDYAWGPDGRRIVSYSLTYGGGGAPEQRLEMITLDRAY